MMMPLALEHQAPVAPPSYQRAQAKQGPALHMNALTLVTTLHLLLLCRLAVHLAHRRCPPPLPAGPGGAPRTYSEESLLLISLLRTFSCKNFPLLFGLSHVLTLLSNPFSYQLESMLLVSLRAVFESCNFMLYLDL